jgi:hypothetical protein
MTEKAKRQPPSLKMVLLVLIFVVPMVVSWVMYNYPDYFSFHTVNHGKLMDPMVTDASLVDAAHTWQIVYAPADCKSVEAEKKMFLLHQLRTALGKDADRVSLSLLTENDCTSADVHEFRRLVGNTAAIRAALEDHQVENKIYLVDPQGNVFIYYAENSEPLRILKDLKRVLEVSQIG